MKIKMGIKKKSRVKTFDIKIENINSICRAPCTYTGYFILDDMVDYFANRRFY